MKSLPRIIVFVGLLAVALFATSVAFAQDVVENASLEDALVSPEAFWLLLGVPITQFLKNHVFASVLDRLGDARRYGVIALSILICIGLALLFEAVNLLNVGYGPALWFGVSAGLIGSGLKDLIPKGGGPLAPASSTSTDAARTRLRR